GYDRVHTRDDPRVVALQERHVRTVVDAVNEFPNVLYEIGNEHDGGSENTRWQHHMIDVVHAYERSEKPLQHPVFMSSQWPHPDNEALLDSPAEVIAPFAWRGQADE